MGIRKKVVIVSEAGWRGARQLSIELSKHGIASTIFIKGKLNRDEVNMITKYKGIKNIFISQKLFMVIMLMRVLSSVIFLKPIVIFGTKEKTEKTLLGLRKYFKNIYLLRLRESKNYFNVFDSNMKPVNYEDFL